MKKNIAGIVTVGVIASSGLFAAATTTTAFFVVPSSQSRKSVSSSSSTTRIFFRDHAADTTFDDDQVAEQRQQRQQQRAHAEERRTPTKEEEEEERDSEEVFQGRMKSIVALRTRRRRSEIRRPRNVKNAISLEEFVDVIDEGRKDGRLVVVRFHATWCKVRKDGNVFFSCSSSRHIFPLKNAFIYTMRSFFYRQTCHAIRPSFDRAASSNPHVIFVDVPVLENNTNLHQGLGVESVPFGHIYHPEKGLIEERKLSRKTFSVFEDLVKMHSSS
jgi:thiol-disulfide isomerase/thioredoxin